MSIIKRLKNYFISSYDIVHDNKRLSKILDSNEFYGDVKFKSKSGEGGQIELHAPDNDTSQNGYIIDQYQNTLRIFGIPSKDGTSKTGVGGIIDLDVYNKTVNFNGYTIGCNSIKGPIQTMTKEIQTDAYGNINLGIQSDEYRILDLCAVGTNFNGILTTYAWGGTYFVHAFDWDGNRIANTSATVKITYVKI